MTAGLPPPTRRGPWIAVRGSSKGAGRDEGQVTILVIGFVVVALALVAVVVSATQVHLERTRLAALADLAALDAAGRVADAAYYAPSGSADRVATGGTPPSGGDPRSGEGESGAPSSGEALALSDDDVAATVDAYLAEHPDAAARWTGLRVLEADSPDGSTARVRLGVVVRPAWTAWVLAPFTDGIAVEASSSARAW